MALDVVSDMRCRHLLWYKGFRVITLSAIDVDHPNKKLPVEYYAVMDADPERKDRIWINADTVEEAERTIDNFLKKLSDLYGKPVKKAKDIRWV